MKPLTSRLLLIPLALILASFGLMVPLEAHDAGHAGSPLVRYANGSRIYQVYIQPPQLKAAPPAGDPVPVNWVQTLCEKQAPLAEPSYKLRPRLVTRMFASVGAMLQGQHQHAVAARAPATEKLAVFDFDLYCDDLPVANACRTVLIHDGRTLAIRDRNVTAGLAKPAMPLQPIAHTVAWPLLVKNSQDAVAQLYPGKTPALAADVNSGPAKLVLWPDLREKKLYPAWTMTMRSTSKTQPYLRRYWVTATQPVRILDYEDLIYYQQQQPAPQPRFGGPLGPFAMPLLPRTPSTTPPPPVAQAAPGVPATASTSIVFAGSGAGTVTANVWDNSPYGPVVSRPMPSMEITVTRPVLGPYTTLTDGAGNFSLPGVSGSSTLTASLSGPACKIINDQANGKTEELATFNRNGSVVNVDFPARSTEETKLAQTTAFLSVTQVYEYVRSYLPERGTKVPRLTTHVNIDSTCNAYYDRSDVSLNFFVRGTGDSKTCPNTAYRDVIYHEYGHAVDDELGGIVDSAYSEGFGDALALLLTRAPYVGQDFYGPGQHLRNSRKVVLWPKVKDGEIHESGQAYSGFCWELTQQLQTAYGQERAYEVAKQLIMGAAVQNPKDIPDAVRLMFFVDSQLYPSAGGSQNAAYLRAAAQSRQLPIPKDGSNLSSPVAAGF